MQSGLINLMDINDHIIRTHLLEAEFSAVCDISRDNYSQAVRADERKRYLFNISIVSHFAVEIDPSNWPRFKNVL